jgi:hypothetical protein
MLFNMWVKEGHVGRYSASYLPHFHFPRSCHPCFADTTLSGVTSVEKQ